MAEASSLDRLSDIYDTDWAIIGGLDRADPLKQRTSARTIFTVVAKGLPGSRKNPEIGRQGNENKIDKVLASKRVWPELSMPKLSYIYFLLYMGVIHDHSTELLKSNILMMHDEYDGIDIISSERYAAWDLLSWGEDYDIEFALMHSTYGIQLAMFSYFYNLVESGRFKSPPTRVPGSREEDLVQEELAYFDHDASTKWFGLPEKSLKDGVQDDFMYANCNGIFGGRHLNIEDFRPRRSRMFWGTMIQPTNLRGRW